MTPPALPPGRGAAADMDPRRPHVWVLDAKEPWFDALADRAVVPDAVRARADSLNNPSAARWLLARRTALRLVLGGYLARPPAELRIVTAPGGKPVLLPGGSRSCALTFSTGHSGDLYCVAVGTMASVGVDVELLRSVQRARSIATRWFGESEAKRFRELPDEALDDEFMRLWTAKEALAKRHGAGLRLMRGRGGDLDVEAAQAGGRLRRFAPGSGYAGALASTEVIDDVEIIRPEENPWTT